MFLLNWQLLYLVEHKKLCLRNICGVKGLLRLALRKKCLREVEWSSVFRSTNGAPATNSTLLNHFRFEAEVSMLVDLTDFRVNILFIPAWSPSLDCFEKWAFRGKNETQKAWSSVRQRSNKQCSALTVPNTNNQSTIKQEWTKAGAWGFAYQTQGTTRENWKLDAVL